MSSVSAACRSCCDEVHLAPPLREVIAQVDAHLTRISTPLVVAIEGGHFDPRDGVTPFALNSLHHALDLTTALITKYDRRVRVVLGVLVDDLGLECATTCGVTNRTRAATTSTLPVELDRVLRDHRFVKRDRVVVSSERNARNRALKRLRRAYEHDVLPPALRTAIDQQTARMDLILPVRGRNVVLAEARGNVWTATCPAVMGQHFTDVLQHIEKRFPAKHAALIVDISEALDCEKVSVGAIAAERVFSVPTQTPVAITSVCWFDDDGVSADVRRHTFGGGDER